MKEWPKKKLPNIKEILRENYAPVQRLTIFDIVNSRKAIIYFIFVFITARNIQVQKVLVYTRI